MIRCETFPPQVISLAIFYRKSITALASLFHHNTRNAHCSYHIYSHNSNLYLDVLCACVQKALRNVKYSPLSLYSICHFGQVVMDLTSVRDLKTPSTIYDGYCMDGNRSPPPYREVPFFFLGSSRTLLLLASSALCMKQVLN